MDDILRLLSEDIGPRFGGTEGEHRAAHALCERFSAEGIPVLLQKYSFIGWQPTGEVTVQLLGNEPRQCSAAPIIYSASTPLGGVTGRVVEHGRKFLIAGLYEMRTYAIIDESGDYLAQLIVEPSGPAIPLLNPNPIYRLPMIVIGASDAAFIDSQLAQGRHLRATAAISAQLIPDAVAYNVVAQYRGDPTDRRRIVVDAHYDTQLDTPGCYDNASGVAGLFGLLRRLRAESAPINVDFVAVASEEIGMHGSNYLVLDWKERGDIENVLACICFDQISAGETLWLWATAGPIRGQLLDSVKRAGLDRLGPVRVDDPMPGCDMWPFHLEGVPSVLYMWWRLPDYHKPTDTIDKVDMAKQEGCVEAARLLLHDLWQSDRKREGEHVNETEVTR